jgi:putative ABC transport system permease protein
VAIVSRAMARRFWGEENAVGRHLSIEGPDGPWLEVVGVAEDVRYRDLTSDLDARTSEPDVYLPFAQEPDDDVAVALRVSAAADRVVPLVRAAVTAVDPQLPIYQVETLEAVVGGQAALQRLGALLLCGFGLVALALAAIGIYGLVAFVVSLSRREIALRMALGGHAVAVVRLIVRQSMLLVGVGVAAGLATSAALSGALSRLLFRVASVDPLTFGFVAVVMLATALAASLLPAWRASRLEPQAVLRGE